MITTLSPRKTITDEELKAVELLRNIRTGKVPSSNDIKQITNPRMRESIEGLALSRPTMSDGPDFWKSYDVLAGAHKRLGELRELVEIAPDATEQKQDPRFIARGSKTLLKLSSIEDIYALPDAQYLIADILEAGSVSLLYGVSGTGKTFTSLDLSLHIVHGLPWHGKDIEQGEVWYINTEGGRGLKKRLKAWHIEHEKDPSPGFRIIPWALDIREHYQILLDTLESLPKAPSLIVIDNFSMCAQGVNQNLQEEVAPVLARVHHIAQTFGSHIMVVHHTNKTGDVNGTMAFRNHVDTMIELKKEDTTRKDSPIVFSCQKSRDDEPFNDIRTELKSVTICAEEGTGRFITSCVVVDCDQPEPEETTPETQRQMLEILQAHGRLSCNQWSKYCTEVHQIPTATFYRFRKVLVSEELISPLGEKVNGKTLLYSLTEKGVDSLG